MAIFNNTLDALIEKTCRVALHDWKSGTCTGGTTSTFLDTNRGEGDDYFNSTTPASRIRIRTTTDGAAPVGEERNITDWVNSTSTGTVGVNFTVAPAAGDTYAILSEFTWDEVKNAVNLAISSVAKVGMTWKVDETNVTLVTDTYEYIIPSGFSHLYRLTMADDDGKFDNSESVPWDAWIIVHDPDAPKIRFLRVSADGEAEDHYIGNYWIDSYLENGRAIRLEGLGYPTSLVVDTDICSINPDYIVWQAGSLLHASRTSEFHQAQAKYCQQQADKERLLVVPVKPPRGAKRVRE